MKVQRYICRCSSCQLLYLCYTSTLQVQRTANDEHETQLSVKWVTNLRNRQELDRRKVGKCELNRPRTASTLVKPPRPTTSDRHAKHQRQPQPRLCRMKGSCGASLRSLMASSSRPRGKSSFAHSARSLTSVAASVKSFASVSRRDNASDAEGSRASSVDPADIFQPPRERMTHRQTEEEAFKKNLKEVQAWRRGRAATCEFKPSVLQGIPI